MENQTNQLLGAMKWLAWIVFIGLIIQAGAIVISYAISLNNPLAAKNLYLGLDLYELRQSNMVHYSVSVFLLAFMGALKGFIALCIAKVLAKIQRTTPFTKGVAESLTNISYYIFAAWIVSLFYNAHLAFLSDSLGILNDMISGEFLYLAGVIFIFAQIFNRGVELQSENQLTV